MASLPELRALLAPEDVTHVLFHSKCPDGFGAAFAAWQVLGDGAQYLPVAYGDEPADLPPSACVLMVDVSYTRAQLEEIRQNVVEIIVLDHHETAQRNLESLEHAHFDMGHSGAVLAWKYFNPGSPVRFVPSFFRYIEDRDLWNFTLPNSREFSAALASYPQDFATWQSLYTIGVPALCREGAAILRYQRQLVASIVVTVTHNFIRGYVIDLNPREACRLNGALCNLLDGPRHAMVPPLPLSPEDKAILGPLRDALSQAILTGHNASVETGIL